jgi:hypothetical protein
MPIRVKLNMQWHIKMSLVGAFSKIEDFETHARQMLVEGFSHYNPELTFEVAEDYGPELKIISLVWDVDLDGVRGANFDPVDHKAAAKAYLVDMMRMWASRIKIEVLRHTDDDDDTTDALVPWDPEFREKSYQAMKAKFAAEDAAA